MQWSPDSKWLTYTLQLENHMRAVFVYSLESQKATQVTDGMSDALLPGLRQEREISLLHRQHQYGTHHGLARYDQ